jgi:Leucine-rich repeat (LRR) protein
MQGIMASPNRKGRIQPQHDLIDARYIETFSPTAGGDYLSTEPRNGKIPRIVYVPLPEEPDFNKLVQEHGFIKARQILKMESLKAHQSRVKRAELEVMKSHEVERTREAIRISTTLGEPSMAKGTIEKILDMTSESMDRNQQSQYQSQSHDDHNRNNAHYLNENENTLIRSLGNCDGSFVVAQSGLDALPPELGNTLFLQTSFLRSISLPRNNLTNLFSINSCQIASIHFRYVAELNLSDNNLTSLPEDIGNMKVLESLNISSNSLSKLPMTFKELKSLTKLNVHRNRFNDFDISIGTLTNLVHLNLSENQFVKLPAALAKLANLTYLDVSDNLLPHLGIIPHVLGPSHLWQQVIDLNTGKKVYYNVITQERYQNIAKHKPELIENDAELHKFQSKSSIREYRRRRLWLSICNVAEWESIMDVRSGWSYYRNNVSGITQWEIPPEIDLIGNLKKLEYFHANNNNIRVLPPSFAMLSNLKQIYFSNNRLVELPNHIDKLTSLEYFKLDRNELKILPSNISVCVNLKELYLQSNQIIRLPDQIGTMPKLEVLDISVNRLKSLSYSLGFCESLKTLHVYENPLTDPPIENLHKGIHAIKWYLRNRQNIELYNAKPPEMKYHQISIMNEITLIQSDFEARIQHLVELSKTNHGIMNLQFMGLKEIPHQITTVTNLRRLQLDYNPELALTLGFIDGPYTSTIRTLSMRSSNIKILPESLAKLKKLRVLNCEMNQIEFLPEALFEFKALQHLGKSVLF